VFAGGVSHEQHLRIAWVLHRRHGATEAKARLVAGTEWGCQRHGCPEKFDAKLTEPWSDAVTEAIEKDRPAASAGAFLQEHPVLMRGSLFGQPNRGPQPLSQ
jgi:hypothetical protein